MPHIPKLFTLRSVFMKEVYIVDGRRTPQAKSGMDLKDIPLPYFGTSLVRAMLDENAVPYEEINDVIIGNTGAPAKYANISRVIALESGLKKNISAHTVHRNCASGMEAISEGFDKIALGRSELVVAGGVECMSQMPLIFSKELTELFIKFMRAKSMTQKIKLFSSFRLPYLSPIIAIEQGLTDPFCGLNMGQTAELLSREFGITREEQDTFAMNSHAKTIKAQEAGKFNDEIVPLQIGKNLDRLLYDDIGPRKDSTVEKLSKLRPYFDRKSGTVTVGNSCPITDGGSMVLLASEEALKKHNLNPIAKIKDYHFHGLEPQRMGMGPLLAGDGVLKRTNLTMDQMDLVELNEAFAAQVLAVLAAYREDKWAKKFDLEKAPGEIPLEKLNVNGGAVALGHPVGSTGCRIVVTLMHELKKQKKKYGLATLCIGGGQGGAMVIENLQQ